MATPKTAIILGATGLVGSFVLQQLLDDTRYGNVKVFGRRSTGLQHPKLEVIRVDFSDTEKVRALVTGDEVYCCLGTTIRAAGSQEKFRFVDFEAVRAMAALAADNKVPAFLLVSSLGAKAGSSNFYLRTKGETEAMLRDFHFPKLVIARPSMLLGPRKEHRSGEKIGQFFMQLLRPLIPARYKAIQAETVARALIFAANDPEQNGVLESEILQQTGPKKVQA